MTARYETLRVRSDGPITRITLDRPERYNAIVDPMPEELRHAVETADADDRVHVIVLDGAGPGFCAGYDLEVYAATRGPNPGVQELPFDATVDLRMMGRNTECFMALWRARTPTIAQVHGAAPAADLASRVDALAGRIATVPRNQLAMHKTVINQTMVDQGLHTAQLLATVFDGTARHTAEGLAFKRRAEQVGWQQAVAERDAP
jgi:enoyl-CoA hydratase/carnithine racemase